MLRRLNPHRYRLGRRNAGQAIVEFALAAPLLCLLMFGIVEFGRYLATRMALRHTVREAARFATTGNVLADSTGTEITRAESIRRVLLERNSLVQLEPDHVELLPADGGGPGEIVQIRVHHDFRFRIPFAATVFPSGVRIDIGTVITNEPF